MEQNEASSVVQQQGGESITPPSSYSLTEGQQWALAVAPVPTALLSVAASGLILYDILGVPRRRRRRRRGGAGSTAQHARHGNSNRNNNRHRPTYHRLLVAMSLLDVLYSITSCLQMFLMPASTSRRVTAVGTASTCAALGFFLQVSLATYWYNGVLSLYYLVTVVHGWSADRVRRRLEPFGHVACGVFAVVTASWGVVGGWYSEMDLGFGCWINDYPRGCEENTTVQQHDAGEGFREAPPCRSDDIAWVVAGIPITLLLFVVIGVNLRIYCHVRSVLLKSRRHDFTRTVSSRSLGSATTTTLNNSSQQHHRQQRSHPQSDRQLRRMRQVAVQGFLYVMAFWMTGMFFALVRIVEAYDMVDNEADVYPLLFIQALWSPSTGFFNMMVYFRPRYLQCRQTFPDETRWWACQRILWGQDVRPRSVLVENVGPQSPADNNNDDSDDNDSHARDRRLGVQTVSRVTFEEDPSGTISTIRSGVDPALERVDAVEPEAPVGEDGEKSRHRTDVTAKPQTTATIARDGESRHGNDDIVTSRSSELFESETTHARLLSRLGAAPPADADKT